MSKKLSESEIDEIFKKAIEPVDSEPSDEFWRKAAEGVISRGSQSNEGTNSRWKVIALILGAGLLILGYFTYKIETGLKSEQQQIAMFKKIQRQEPGKYNASISSNNAINNVANNSVEMSVKTDISSKENNTLSLKNKIVKYTPHTIKTPMSNATSYASQNKSVGSQPAIFAFSNQSQNGKQYKKFAKASVTYNANDKILSNNQDKQANSSTTLENSTDNLSSTPSLPDIQKPVHINPDSSIQKPPVGILTTSKQTLIAATDTPKITPLSFDSLSARFSISGFFSPEIMMGYKFASNSSWGSQIESVIKSGEKQTFSYTTGVKAEYILSSHFSISVGIAYQSFSFNADPGYIYAQKQSGGDIAYSIPTSSGVVDCPYYGPIKIGDSLKMSISSSRTYLVIPIYLKYFIVNNIKLKFYLIGGTEANISLGEETYMNWQNYVRSGVSEVNNAEGAGKLYLSYYIGMGVDYRIWKQISLYLEPGLNNAFTPIDNNIEVISYPRLLSVTTGVTYHF